MMAVELPVTRIAGENHTVTVIFSSNFDPNDLVIKMTIIQHVRYGKLNTQTRTIKSKFWLLIVPLKKSCSFFCIA